MRIEKVNIENYKCYEGKFSITFNAGVNIIVGDNEAGKSTILEAINLALTGVINGRYLKNELSQYLFNYKVVESYLSDLKNGANPQLPSITIEVFFSDANFPLFEGNGNQNKEKAHGVVFKIEFDESYKAEYQMIMANGGQHLTTLPIEYYKVSWSSFARETVTSRTIPIKSVLIDSTSAKYQNGSDVYISRIIKNDLEDLERVRLSQAYRKMKDQFIEDDAVKAINTKITAKAKISEKTLNVSVDLSTQNSWETALMTYLDNVPFHQIGKGEQCIIKTNLALAHQRNQEANLVLIEEPENHLSHTKLNQLIKTVSDSCIGKQVIISTHSSYVANKLGLENLILLNDRKVVRLADLDPTTFDFFKKLPGYQTLRILLCKKAVLVEGDSDELIFQKCYMESNDARLPIEDGIDVISVKLTFKRFLDIAIKIKQPVAVITDNDGNYDSKITKKYKDYLGYPCVKIFADLRDELNTLEPQFVSVNSQNLKLLREVLELDDKHYDTAEKIVDHMVNNKTSWALKVFESKKSLHYPDYIQSAVKWCNE
ncbi:RecF/RecN/SMC N-terminal domain-containing protein [Rheinheimera sp. A13L]|uniref:ATP-dependent nuclease n=1 Tax=Rheinheimera sp. A13L TaxID=506534 RepID=UPI0002124F5E|nr:AAA family ATPase [Rheinheimera sp. A13L]EGM79811.1 RecF/RecN/SMC N-terminal domain-containing protein [Rheinheimera sp. A13L]